MEITSHSLIAITKNISLAGGKAVAQSGGLQGVRRISPVNVITDRQYHEKVISGELLDKQSARNSSQSNSSFTYDQKRETHPGFYPKYDRLIGKTQQAINLYQTNMHTPSQESNPAVHQVDYFV